MLPTQTMITGSSGTPSANASSSASSATLRPCTCTARRHGKSSSSGSFQTPDSTCCVMKTKVGIVSSVFSATAVVATARRTTGSTSVITTCGVRGPAHALVMEG